MKTSDDYAACLCVYPSGVTRRASVLAVRLCGTAEAERRLRSDYAATIAPGDWPALCERMAVNPPARWNPATPVTA